MSATTDGEDLHGRLDDEADSWHITTSDTDAIYVETETLEGEHRVWFASSGPRLHDRGIYRPKDTGAIEIEAECPCPHELREHFHDEFGGSGFGQ